MSAALATSSVMAVDGVSGDIATPAFMLRLWILSMSAIGLSGGYVKFLAPSLDRCLCTCCLKMEAVHCAASIRNIVNPLGGYE
jgi:hypothetical protein